MNERYAVYMQVIKNDICLQEVCTRLAEEGVHDFCFCQPDQYWSGEAVEPENSAEVSAVMDALKQSGQTVHHRMFNVDSYRMPGDASIIVETRLRNDSLDWIRSLGYQHILLVDGDELWVRGGLSIVKNYVNQGYSALRVHWIPVVGFPGYPIEGALDTAPVYFGAGVKIKWCRDPSVQPLLIPSRPLIYHFTSTRKDLEETVKKHRRSGHYGDPDYDFDGWIKNTLPSIKPGAVNAHMHKHFQIWPRVRAWSADELAEMPESVRPYLGYAQ